MLHIEPRVFLKRPFRESRIAATGNILQMSFTLNVPATLPWCVWAEHELELLFLIIDVVGSLQHGPFLTLLPEEAGG